MAGETETETAKQQPMSVAKQLNVHKNNKKLVNTSEQKCYFKKTTFIIPQRNYKRLRHHLKVKQLNNTSLNFVEKHFNKTKLKLHFKQSKQKTAL